MHFTGTVYRNPYWPTWPLLEITQGCTHNKCKFCTMYKDVSFRMSPMEWIEEDLQELAQTDPDATTIQLLSANPLVLSYDRLSPILEMINRYLPKMKYIYLAGRVSDLKNKTVDELRKLRDLGMREISLGVESGDDWTLDRIHNLQRVVIPASVTYIDDDNIFECGDAVGVTPRGSYAWQWTTGWSIPVQEPD